MLSYYLNCPDSKTNHCSDQIPDPKPKFIIKRNIKIKSIKFRKGRRYNNVYSLIDASKVIMQNQNYYSCLQIPPRVNWIQYVRRVYATAINFPCIITLDASISFDIILVRFVLD